MSLRRTSFIAAISIQIIIIVAIIMTKLIILHNSTTVLLNIEPIDPRSPLRGDYITFTYKKLSRIIEHSGETFSIGDTVYVPLKLRSNGYAYRIGHVQKTPPTNGTLYIAGRVHDVRLFKPEEWNGRRMPQAVPLPSGNEPIETYSGAAKSKTAMELTIVYGIEDYFIPEGTGRNIPFSRHVMSAEVAIDGNGRAVLKRILMEGKPWPPPSSTRVSGE